MAKAKKRRVAKKGRKSSSQERIIYHPDARPDRRRWFYKSLVAQALADRIWHDIHRVGVDRFVKSVHKDLIRHIFNCGANDQSELEKTQRNYLGSVTEQIFARVLGWKKQEKGKDFAFRLCVDGKVIDSEHDMKTSNSAKNKGKRNSRAIPLGFQISRECWDSICILVSVCTYTNKISVGIIDCSVHGYLKKLQKKKKNDSSVGGPQRDQKRALSPLGIKNIVWIFYRFDTPPNPIELERDKFVALRKKQSRQFNVLYERALSAASEQNKKEAALV